VFTPVLAETLEVEFALPITLGDETTGAPFLDLTHDWNLQLLLPIRAGLPSANHLRRWLLHLDP